MKQLLTTFFCLILAPGAITAQTRIMASDIIRQINDGRTVEFSNVEIQGDLDFTSLKNRKPKHSGDGSDQQNYESTVEVPVRFINCTFFGDVLAYYHDDREKATYIAHFEKDVIFRNCAFNEGSEFKYSEFNGPAVFDGCTFREEANFKYAEFSEGASYTKVTFESRADFKYTEFTSGPSFSNAKFESGADFKYTEFPRQTSFEKAVFRGKADFKYSKFKSPLNIDDVAFNGSEDFKYTEIDGRNFTSFLLKKKS
ncbi:MAG: pentapeptide repeat-containing protein [Bacteroidota bacterium]|nr:pentapeptide repeat-containing protein [Bacteroidota bacterium]